MVAPAGSLTVSAVIFALTINCPGPPVFYGGPAATLVASHALPSCELTKKGTRVEFARPHTIFVLRSLCVVH